MKKRGISEFLMEHGGMEPVSFHMPGHKGSAFYRNMGYDRFLRDFPDRDVTEISGADNLFQPEGIISLTMEKYRALYDTKATYLLINGSSGGLIASILACVRPGGKLIMARNCHKSIFNALSLGHISPVYVHPEEIGDYGIAGAVSPEDIAEAIEENPDASCVILPSPNYYGICSDIRRIAQIVHGAGMVLIVDQAHGAHLKFFETYCSGGSDEISGVTMPPSAESSGADLVINSTHKTLGSLTQSAVLNVCRGEFADSDENMFSLEDRLQAVESTSPSYLLMESLDINGDIIEDRGAELFGSWLGDLEWFYKEAENLSYLRVMKHPALDMTKINLDMHEAGLDGDMLDVELMKRGIYGELSTGNILMCMTGIGNCRKDYEKLLSSLEDIEKKSSSEKRESNHDGEELSGDAHTGIWTSKRQTGPLPQRRRLVSLAEAEDCVCASSIIPYPPGIPLLCPGEIITCEDVDYIRKSRAEGKKIIGVDRNGRVSVG